jgi:hypothetical protein
MVHALPWCPHAYVDDILSVHTCTTLESEIGVIMNIVLWHADLPTEYRLDTGQLY